MRGGGWRGKGGEGGNVRRGRRGGGKRGGTDIEKDVCSDATIHLFEQVTHKKNLLHHTHYKPQSGCVNTLQPFSATKDYYHV